MIKTVFNKISGVHNKAIFLATIFLTAALNGIITGTASDVILPFPDAANLFFAILLGISTFAVFFVVAGAALAAQYEDHFFIYESNFLHSAFLPLE